MEIDPGEAQKFGLKVRHSENVQEETLIYYDKLNGIFNVDRTKSSIDLTNNKPTDPTSGGAVDSVSIAQSGVGLSTPRELLVHAA